MPKDTTEPQTLPPIRVGDTLYFVVEKGAGTFSAEARALKVTRVSGPFVYFGEPDKLLAPRGYRYASTVQKHRTIKGALRVYTKQVHAERIAAGKAYQAARYKEENTERFLVAMLRGHGASRAFHTDQNNTSSCTNYREVYGAPCRCVDDDDTARAARKAANDTRDPFSAASHAAYAAVIARGP